MAEGKKSFQLYTDLIELVKGSNKHNVEIEPMTNEEAGMLFKWILEYVNDLHPSVPKEIRFAVAQVKKQLDEDLERWKDICRKNTENIRKRWNRNENESIRPNTTVYDSIPSDTKNTDKDKDKDIYIDKLINDKSCVRTHENINLNPVSKEENQILKEELNNRKLDISEFYLLHKLIKPYYFNSNFNLDESITLSEVLKKLDGEYDKYLVAKAFSYSMDKSIDAKNRVGYIVSILEKNIKQLISKESF